MTGLGGCIGLIVVGAILTFATDWEMESVNLDVVGLIMMAVGFIGLAVYTSVLKRRRAMGALPVVEQRRDI
ncbi:hypothetical protein J7E99_04065 [Streptomyces sp. ISL-44]|uniref:hypothetical protein n=1 Tax=unclassified Streptomyces TaxID=2593676 RepID=UPI001BE6C659|nr:MULTISPECIES: hypothetical protein [unclassified Streptomyces]MBT2539902.1 hypothetical protein [Streptomyces sp. ISL-44]MCX5011618.1 hypothetical protein [Streptomyces sp. NBC_00555]MCX5612106.1 hypothetical protein [Streptomyces sp. NBC_00047]UUU39902.1 hypothetical protein JIW86_14490 [Streptomyces sp. NBC_00162]